MSSQGDRGHLTLQPVFEYREELLLPYHLSERVIGARDDVQIERRPVVERREKQIAYNKKHKITPKTIAKKIHDIIGDIQRVRDRAVSDLAATDMAAAGGDITTLIKQKRQEMHEAADKLDFETAALLRDEVRQLELSKSGKK